MIKLLTKETMHPQKAKLTLIYILNCTDMLFTYTLLKTGHFYEVNWLMRPIVSNPILSVLVKIIFPAALILNILPHLKEDKVPVLNFCHISINTVILAYIIINMLHVYYLIALLNFL